MPDDSRLPPMAHEQFEQDGYILCRGVFSCDRIHSLVDAVSEVVDRADRGEIEIPWIDRGSQLPARLSHLLSPDRYVPAFAQWLDDDMIALLEAAVGNPIRHSLFGMLAGGGGQSYEQGWHRDLGKPGAPDEAEYLQRHHGRFIQLNAPLQASDRFLNIVPGSHLRASTSEEIEAQNADPSGSVEMPGAMVVELEPGDVVMYNANLWHRGWNPEGKMRWTLHAAFWLADVPVMAHEWGQREVLSDPGHLEALAPGTRTLIERYLAACPESNPKALNEL